LKKAVTDECRLIYREVKQKPFCGRLCQNIPGQPLREFIWLFNDINWSLANSLGWQNYYRMFFVCDLKGAWEYSGDNSKHFLEIVDMTLILLMVK